MIHTIDALQRFLADAQSIAVLSGAGVSTASGIPDYRDEDGNWKHRQPIQFGEFRKSAAARRRYWARSFAGWRRFGSARPNPAHHAIAELESLGAVNSLVTQNVDGLHRLAGSRRVIDLHGDLALVRCLDCGATEARAGFQERLEHANPGWHVEVRQGRPDGDAELGEDRSTDAFVVPDCVTCGGVLKPDVVMFGEAVPKERVEAAIAGVERADGLLVTGSSLMLYSGYRFASLAAKRNIPIAIVNRGRTRADPIATVKVEDDCTTVLPAVVERLRVERAVSV